MKADRQTYGIHVREMKESDLAAAGSLYKRMYEEQRSFGMTMELNPGEVDGLLQAQLKSKLYVLYVAEAVSDTEAGAGAAADNGTEDERRLVGFGFGSMIRTPKKYKPFDEEMPFIGFIHDVYVEPEFRGSGLARRIVEALERDFAEQGIGYVELHVLSGNPRGKRFWEAGGYRDVLQAMYKKLPGKSES